MSIFLSYSRDDKQFVDRLSLSLLEKNFKVWRDEWKLKGGDSLADKIGGAITEAGFLCVVLSDHALASRWVEREIKLGLLAQSKTKRLTILPILIGDLKDSDVPPPLKDIRAADSHHRIAKHERLLHMVGMFATNHRTPDDKSLHPRGSKPRGVVLSHFLYRKLYNISRLRRKDHAATRTAWIGLPTNGERAPLSISC
jgi:hypothetical protein